MDKPLPNRCGLMFPCGRKKRQECEYRGCLTKEKCDASVECNSARARVNACVRYLKASGISKEELHRMVEAINDPA